MKRVMLKLTIMPCLNCTFDCGLNEDLSFIWNNSAEPSDDPDFFELVNALVSSLSELVKTRQVATPDDLGVALAALFDLCVSVTFLALYAHNLQAVLDIIRAWQRFYEGYERKWGQDGDDRLRWLTFGCGGQVDDSKNSPGIDRTDDIKKGIYQTIKLGEHFVSRCAKRAIKVVLLSNVHAVRHHNDYLSGIEDMIWTHENLLLETDDPDWRKVRVDDLIRLYDAAIAFTKPHFRDSQLAADFGLDVLLSRLGGR